jgi:hypothetical protein
MTDHRRKHLEEALRACAEAGVPNPGDPWPAIRERAGERLGRRAGTGARRRRLRLLPRTRAGWVFAVLLVLLFGTAAYAVSGLTRSDLTIEEAALRSGEQGDEIVVRVRATGSANLPWCILVEGAAQNESSWPDEDLTESWQVGNTTVFVFHEDQDPIKNVSDPKRTPFYAVCSAGTGPGGSGPGVRSDAAHVAGTLAGGNNLASDGREFVRKDMSSQQIRPPVAILSSGEDSVEGAAGPYCWSPGSKSEEENVLWCWNETGVEGQVPPQEDTLHVSAGSTMVLKFGGEAKLDSVVAGAWPLFYGELTGRPAKELRAIRSGDHVEIPADLPPGEYLLGVFVSGPKGEADYAFRVAVEREPGSRS